MFMEHKVNFPSWKWSTNDKTLMKSVIIGLLYFFDKASSAIVFCGLVLQNPFVF